MPISGSFKAAAANYRGSSGTVTESTRGAGRFNWGTGVNRGHLGNEPAPAGQSPPGAPHADVVPDEMLDTWTIADAPVGTPADYEPPGHDGIATVPAYIPAREADRLNARARSLDRGANHTRQVPMVSRDASNQLTNGVWHSLDISTGRGDAGLSGESERALRGRNSLALNNPGSPEVNFSGDYNRQGGELVRYMERNLGTHGMLDHTKRPRYENEATTAKDSAPAVGAYPRPFANFARMNAGTTTPVMRREPRPYYEEAITDAVDESSYESDVAQYWNG